MGIRFSLLGLGLLTLLGCWAGPGVRSAQAEGSNDLISSGGDRPYLEYRNDSNGGILRRTVMKVYANEGEDIYLGSSAVGLGNGVINYRDPNNAAGSCGGNGLIANRAEEAAGPRNGVGVPAAGFEACKVTVGPGQTGIWEVDFVSPSQETPTNPTPRAGTAEWAPQPAGVSYISAWDITVRNGATAIPGRVYANYYAFNIGNNGRSLSSSLVVLTQEGYRYSIDLNGIDPFGFIFFSNRNSFYEQTSGDPLFRSLQFVGSNPGQLPPTYFLHNPNAADTPKYVTHKSFINTPAPDMPTTANSPTGNTWLYRSVPVAPPVPSNFEFVGIEGTSGRAGTSPLGGTLLFNSPQAKSFSITIDIDGDGAFGTGNDRTFLGRSVVGPNSVFWDGLDGNGDPVPAGNVPYSVRLNLYAGEAHFPIIDAEQHPNGFIIFRQNNPVGPTSVSEDPFNIYYDDRATDADFTVCEPGEPGGDCYGVGPNPRAALTGINSSTGAHEFSGPTLSNGFGNRRGIDTWVYYPSADVELAGGILLQEADLIVDKTVNLTTADPGDSLTYTVTVTNDGPSNESGIRFEDAVPPTLVNVSWSCAITTGNGSCDEASGTGNGIATTLNLDNQAVATYTITGDLAATASGTITNEATAIRNNDITDPDPTNNSDDAVTTIARTPPPDSTICYAVADGSNTLMSVDINTGVNSAIGSFASQEIKAIAHWPATNTLYAASGNQLGTLNTNTGAYSAIGTFGAGTGSAGTKTFSNLKGLSFNPFTGELYGAVRDGEGTPEDLLIQIDPSTGRYVSDAFGTGDDYLVIRTAATTGFSDIDDIAFDPSTGKLFAIANDGASSADRLVTIDITNGSTTNVGALGISNVEGLTAYNDGSLYATTGDSSRRFYRVDKSIGLATEINQFSAGDDDYEGIACLTGAANRITGTVFLDPNTDGVFNGSDSGTPSVNVRLYRDINGNGQVDSSDLPLAAQLSAASGTFDFPVAAIGSFVLDIDPATLPPDNSTFTTDNVEVANFGTLLGITDINNNYGHFTDSNLVLVKRITAINGVRLTDSVDDPADTSDNHPNWPSGLTSAGISSFLAGATDSLADAEDEVEYTIYYLATGNAPVTNVKMCDRIPTNTTYVVESTVLFTNSTTDLLTDTGVDGDEGEFLPIGDTTTVPCPGTNDNGTVSITLAPSPALLPNATGPGTPTDSYGFVRFRVTVD